MAYYSYKVIKGKPATYLRKWYGFIKIKRSLINLQFHQQYITLSISKTTAILQTLC